DQAKAFGAEQRNTELRVDDAHLAAEQTIERRAAEVGERAAGRLACDRAFVRAKRAVAVTTNERFLTEIDRPRRLRIFRAAAVAADRDAAEGERERTEEEIPPVIEQRRLILRGPERRRELQPIPLALHRADERGERVVTDERDGRLGE